MECWEEDGIKRTKAEQLNVSLGTRARGGVDEGKERRKKKKEKRKIETAVWCVSNSQTDQ